MILCRKPVPLRSKFFSAVDKVLALPLGIGDIGILVPKPAFDILNRSPEILVLCGEGRDLSIVKLLLEAINRSREARDLVCDPLEIRLKPRKLLATGLGVAEQPAQGHFQSLFLAAKHIDAL